MELYQDYSPLQIKDMLGWSNQTGEEAVSEIRIAVMKLCDRVAEIETSLAFMKAEKDG
jgi:hypothetical protein